MTKSDLEQIREIKYDIRRLKAKYDALNSRSIVGSPVPGAARGSGVSNKVAQTTEQKLLLEQEIAEKEAQLKERIDFINGISDNVLREIVYCRCVHKFSWQEIADKVGGNNDQESVRKLYDRFMSKL